MKILELRFKNLNSLYGEWIIDFSDPAYISNGIFALTGPTGAGKSTILDAICLALYGATPRLGKITKSSNEIMSRQTGECYAEVLFESQLGRFRCHWEQRRARKSANGNLQDQEHQIAEGDSGKVIEAKKSLVGGVIEEKTGMDFERFTRSILLAQGGFDAFLRADVEQKSKILEQITGTEIYSQISRRVHERQRDEREKLHLLQAEASGIVILAPEQEKAIHQDLETKQKQEKALTVKLTETSKAIAWLTTIEELNKEISSLAKDALRLQSDVEAFQPQRVKLDQATKAAALDGSYAILTALRKHQSDDRMALEAEEMALPGLELSTKRQAELLKSLEQQTVIAKEALKAAAPDIQKIRRLDQKLTELKKLVSESAAACKKDAEKINADKQVRATVQEKWLEAEKNLQLIDGYLKDHAQDEWLIGGLAGIEVQLGGLLSKQKEITQKEADIKRADIALAQAVKQLEGAVKRSGVCKQQLEDTAKKCQQQKDALHLLLKGRLLREYRAEKEALLREMAYLRKIAALEDHRAKLEDGKPCPLCGSKEHPFAEGNIPAPDETEQQIASLTRLISKAEDLETANIKLQEAEAVARKNLTDSEKLQATAANEKKTAERALMELQHDLVKIRAAFSESKLALTGRLQPLGFTEIPEQEISSLLDSLKSRLRTWQEQVEKKNVIEKHIAAIHSEIKRLDAVLETQSVALSEKQERLEALKKEYVTARDERIKLFGNKKPGDEENCLNKAVAEAEEAEKKVRALNSEMQQKLTAAKTQVDSLKKRIEQREPELKKAQTDFSAALKQAGFADEKQFLAARLTNEQRDMLSARAKELDNAQTALKARQKDREMRLAVEINKKITERRLDELEPQLKEYEQALKQLRDAIAGLKHKLSENATAKERIKEKQTAIEAQKKECQRWEKLHGLIGSADGKKYRNFAQGLTFELMVSHANRQLAKMTDRYLLIRDEEQPLELNVVDNYQASEIRSSKNLSGGESFIVSLALALGLSRMASHKVRVDSLFLDEGFGTLDEDALETALEALSSLQQGGKLIGIISHVSPLKERIGTQISITPVSGGRSSLAGPGCKKLAR